MNCTRCGKELKIKQNEIQYKILGHYTYLNNCYCIDCWKKNKNEIKLNYKN
jgi:hypothetical protein